MSNEALEIARVRALLRDGRARAIRERAGLSQGELARTLGVDTATVSRWESGVRAPRGAAAKRLGRLLKDLSEVAP